MNCQGWRLEAEGAAMAALSSMSTFSCSTGLSKNFRMLLRLKIQAGILHTFLKISCRRLGPGLGLFQGMAQQFNMLVAI